MRTTTIGDLAEAFTTTIRELTPETTAYQDHRWSPVDDPDQVPGGELRRYFVDMPVPVPVRDGIYSPDAIEHEVECLVYTSYPNLRRSQQRALAAEDGRQVWLALDVLRDTTQPSTIAGLVSIEHTGWDSLDDDQAQYWGAHTFVVRFLANGLPP